MLCDPLNGEPLVGDFPVKEKGHHAGLTGVLRSSLREFPVIGGVVICCEDLATEEVIKYAKKGDYFSAIFWALEAEKKQTLGEIIKLQLSLKWPRIAQFYSSPCGVSKGDARKYSRYRYYNPDLPACIGLISCLNRSASKSGFLLDVGCGYGHFYQYYLHSYQPEKIICIDKSLDALVTMSRFIDTTKTILIYCDVDKPLPFQKNMFSDILSINSFSHLKNKEIFIKNMIELLDVNLGTMWLTNNWNPKITDQYKNISYTPSKWRSVLDSENFRIFPERYFAESVLKNNCLINIGVDYKPMDDHPDWRCVTLAYSNASWDRNNTFVPLNRTPNLRQLNLNSIYKLLPVANLAIRRRVGMRFWGSNRKYYGSYLPERVKIPKTHGRNSIKEIRELAETLVMVESTCKRRNPIIVAFLFLLVGKLQFFFSKSRFIKALKFFIPGIIKAQIKTLIKNLLKFL